MSARVEQLKIESLNRVTQEVLDKFSFDLLESPLFDRKCADQFLDKYCESMDKDMRKQTKKLVGDFRDRMEKLRNELCNGLRTGRSGRAMAACRELKALLDGRHPRYSNNAYALAKYVENARANPGAQVGGRSLDVTPGWRQRFTRQINDVMKINENGTWRVLMSRFDDMLKIFKGGSVPVVNGSLLAKVIDGTCGFSTAALLSAWGEDGESAMPGIDDRHLVSSKKLGSGACNTVQLCSYRRPDGSKQFRVFKPEIPARFSLEEVRKDFNYGVDQKVSMLNVAACRMAGLLGLENRVVGAHAGVHFGQFGLMMDLAEGMTGDSISDAFKVGDMDKRIGKKSVGELRDILNANDSNTKKLLGNLRHAYTDLDWFDHIIGQDDRHTGNYMISIGDDLSVTLKGIDNDICFSASEEVSSDTRCYPPVISLDTYERLERLVGEMEGLDVEGVRQLLRRNLGMTALTDQQLDRTADRIRRAWAHASSPEECTVIRSEDEWGDRDSMQRQVSARGGGSRDYFTRDLIAIDIFGRAGLTGNFIPGMDGSKVDQVTRERFVCMQNVLNIRDDDLSAMIQRLDQDGQPFSMAEFRTYFAGEMSDPSRAESSVDPWPEDLTDESVLPAMLKSYRRERALIVEDMRTANIQLADDELSRYMPLCFTGKSNTTFSRSECAETFVKSFAAITGHPAFARPEIRDLLKYGGGFDGMLFVAECKGKVPREVDEALIVKAFMTELMEPGFNPEQMDVGRLRRLVVNKLTVTPQQVLGSPDPLGREDMAVFRMACATTPAGADYYADVATKYNDMCAS